MNNDSALTVIEQNRNNGALVFVDQNAQPSTELYRLEATVVTLGKDDVHNISGKIMPKREAVDRIGEAAGIVFLDVRGDTETRDDIFIGKHTVFIGRAQGKVRISDGSWRTSSFQEYEIDPVLRAMLDKGITELTAENKKIVGKAIQEYQKFGKQRAQTGARLRVIRELTGMPTALTQEQAAKPLVFARIVQNTSYILQTPEGRALATAQALGMDMAALYGRKALPEGSAGDPPMEDVTVEPEDSGAGQENAAGLASQAAAAGGAAGGQSDSANEEFSVLSIDLENILNTHKDVLNVQTKSGNPYQLGKEELGSFGATAETHREMIDRLRKYLKVQGVAA